MRDKQPCFDVWICQGRMCSSKGSDELLAVAEALPGLDGARLRLLRGGCYGLCEISPNVVVRRFDGGAPAPNPDDDRLSLTGQENEVVYSCVTPAGVAAIVRAHLEDDAPCTGLTRGVREDEQPPSNPVAAKIRALRQKRGASSEGPTET